MGFGLHTIAHLAGDVAAPVVKGAGAVLGDQQIYNAGAAIANPSLTYSGGAGGGLGVNNAVPGAFVPVSQPAPTSTHNTNTGNNGGSLSGANTGSNGGYYDASGNYYATAPQQAAPVDLNKSYEDIINGALGRLPGELQTAQSNVHKQFNTNQNELQSGYDAAKQNYGQSTTQNQQQWQTNKNQIQDSASAGLTSLERLLGSHGAGGSSAALYAAPTAVATSAAQQNAGAGQNYGQNQQALDTNWNTYQTGFDNSKKQLNDWLTTQLNNAKTTNDTTAQGLQERLLALQPSVAAAQPMVDKINSLSSAVDALQKFNPTYDGKTPTYTAPSVSSYQVTPQSVQQNATSVPGTLTPSLYTLLGLNQRDKNQPNLSLQG